MPDVLIKLYCFWCRLNIQFFMKCFDTYLVLAQCERVLSQAAVAAHDAAVHILPAIISIQNYPAQGDTGGVSLLA